MDSKILVSIINLNTGNARQRKEALLNMINFAAADNTPPDQKRELLSIIQDYMQDTYLISKDLSKWQGREYL